MSYCRFADGDVYMFPSCDGGIECCYCTLNDRRNVTFDSKEDAIGHLQQHRLAGDDVPEWAEEEVRDCQVVRFDS
jgi:hypothetical protein